jgi:hypothetical protein
MVSSVIRLLAYVSVTVLMLLLFAFILLVLAR